MSRHCLARLCTWLFVLQHVAAFSRLLAARRASLPRVMMTNKPFTRRCEALVQFSNPSDVDHEQPPIVDNSNDNNNNFAMSYLSSLQHTEPVGHDRITGLDQIVLGLSATAFAIAFLEMFLSSGWRFYLAGGICAAVSHTIATPIDVVKTRKQVDPDLVDKSFTQAAARIIEREGIKTLLSGLGPTTVGYFLEGAVKFGVYESMKPRVLRLAACLAGRAASLAFLQSRLVSFVICGAISGVAASAVLCPLEAIRIRLVAEPNFCRDGWIRGGFKMFKREGFQALSKGMSAMLYKQVPYTISKNVAFDVLTKASYGFILASGMTLRASTKVYVPLICALLTSVVATICSQPGDMLLSLVNAHEGKRRTKAFIRDILKSEWGIQGFFVGTKSRFLHVGLIVTVQLILYDFIKRAVGIAATGTV